MSILSIEEAAILAHVIQNPDEWINRAIANDMEWAIQEKIDANRQDYLNAKYLSITVDPETGIETRIENPEYLNRAERDALEELKRDPLYDKTEAEIVAIKKQQLNLICQTTILARFSLIHQIDVAHGIYPDNGMKQWIADMVIESNRCCDLIDLGQAYTAEWPEYVEVV